MDTMQNLPAAETRQSPAVPEPEQETVPEQEAVQAQEAVQEPSPEQLQEARERKKARARERAARQQFIQRRSSHNVLLTGLFLLVIVLFFFINLAVKDREFSDAENRNLAQKPALSVSALTDGSWTAQRTSWFSDQFFGRDRWLSMNLWTQRALGRKESGGVYLGAEGRMFQQPETPDQQALAGSIAAINQFAADYPNISVSMLLAPGAAAVQPEALPKNAPVRDQLQDIGDVERSLSGVQILGASQTLLAHADEEIYYKTDHHWTSLGAYYVLAASADQLDITLPEYDVYTVATDFQGTLSSKSGSHAVSDSIQIYAPKTDVKYYVTYDGGQDRITSVYSVDALEVKDKYTVFFGGNHALTEIQTTAHNGRTLLVFKDSYANCFLPMLVPCYEKIIIIDPRYYYDGLDTFLNGGVTDVLLLYSADTFLTDTSLVDVLSARTMPDSFGTVAPDQPASPEIYDPDAGEEGSAEEGSAEEGSEEETEDSEEYGYGW